ncbi:hypothetical protein EMPS_03729 [Entomortierella parvispora]|uniref:Uncharacterized protein n=1 Tax=Entomortierella parvispora TaxID=205924 RepID=A0A9P3LUX6_9FUNG|nr:hypothetical protein EMPS_03729 [Entomortierella parvispora]
MTNPTEIVETESVQVTEVVEDHHKASLKERIVDKLTGHDSHEHKKEGEEHHSSNDFAEKAFLTAENPVFPQQVMGGLGHGFVHQGHSAGGYVVGIPHENPHKHTEDEHHHHHHHHEDKEDKFQKYGDKVAGTDYHAANTPIHHPVK